MEEQLSYYEHKLKFEMDSFDLKRAMELGEKVQAIDARSVESYENEHIPGAINIPHRSMTDDNTSHLDKNILYVTYCDGIGCNASTHGALKMLKLGFRVKELMGGIDWWKRDSYETHGIKATEGKKIACGC
jgi:rhodanese-related sulfurtransferase